MPAQTDLLVIGAGPYAYSVAAQARDRGIATHVVGRPMAFWREQMPTDMFLRSGTDWHLDGSGVETFEAFLEDRGLRREDVDPVPIAVFLEYTEWFRDRKHLDVDERFVSRLSKDADTFVATMEDGATISAAKVVAAPGIRHFAQLPDWHTRVSPDRQAHTCDLVSFDDLAGARVTIVGGRQSAYEWAALLCDHGAAHVDVVHRHATPRFAKVSWAFCNPYVEETLAHRGWWRTLPPTDRQAIAREFWEVGRLTLEPWLTPRLRPSTVTSHPGCEVASVEGTDDLVLTLSDGDVLHADFVVFASGYRADLAAVPYLRDLLDDVSVTDGFPDLTEGFETTLPGLYVTGFAATRDFGPFYGFTRGCASAAQIAVAEMLA